ncbi:DUF6478 family protein [Algirhabdus cladophorae]|uniref:DUF6478 family protein n=1 Tax=Algirhabdus cladophorae TaxID=3377108 RepID=UPI003B846C77
MAGRVSSIMDRLLFRRSLRRWGRDARLASEMPLATLRHARSHARQLRGSLDRLIYEADSRLTLPLVGSNAMRRPPGADWLWRPELWRGPLPRVGMSSVQSKATFGQEATVFHDCQISELTLRQTRNSRDADLAPFGLRMDVFGFDGSFLSLVLNLPKDACKGLTKSHLVRLDCIVEMEKPLEIFARLNIKHGPNTEQIVRELPLHESEVMVEFDLAYTKMNEKRIERMWVDLIFEGPEMNQIVMRDLTFSRSPRADL